MNKINFGEFDALEKVGGGVFGVIAIGGAIAEMVYNGLNAASIAGCIKDVAGTLIVVMILIAALRRILPKHGFDEVFEDEMKNVVERYKPAVKRGEDVKRGETIRNYVYNIAADLNCIIGAEPKNYTTEFFYINEKDCTITFKVRKTVFFGSSSEKKNEELEKIAEHIKNCVNTRFAAGKIANSNIDIKELNISFNYIQQATPEDTAKMLASVVDYVILLYIAENKK